MYFYQYFQLSATGPKTCRRNDIFLEFVVYKRLESAIKLDRVLLSIPKMCLECIISFDRLL